MAATIQVKVTADVSAAEAAIAKLTSKKVDIKIGGNTQSATNKLEKLNAELGKLQNSKYAVRVDTGAATSGLNKLQAAGAKANTGLSNLLKTASKYATWYALGTAITTMVNAFSDAINTMKEVDTQLTNIQKVSADADIEGISQRIYENASKYGVAAQDFGASIYEFQKAGYGEASEQMAELATKTMLVGDTTASVADKFLIVADTAWNMGHSIEDLNTLIDEADYINNNYATSLDKLAEGFPRVASVASMAGMSAEETMAALGTITASTQETASKAGTALRALILNILGDTTTEVEEGVTVTEDQVKSLRGVLNIYAKDVVAAADATGELIDPMEAIGALSKAYKDGLLTSADLYKIESALGGKLRTNQLDALLKNFDTTYTSMMEGMKTAAGTADKEIETMMGSWEKKVQVLQNTWTQFVANTVDTDWIKGILDGVTSAIEAVGNLGNALGIVGGIILAIKAGTIGQVFLNAAIAAEAAAGSTTLLAEGLLAIGAAAEAALPVLGIFAAAVIGITALAHSWNTDFVQGIEDTAEASSNAAEGMTLQANAAVNAADRVRAMGTMYKAGLISVDEYKASIEGLNTALGDERDITTLTSKAVEANAKALADQERAVAAAYEQINLSDRSGLKGVADIYGHGAYSSASEYAKDIVKAYDEAVAVLADGKASKFAKEDSKKIVDALKDEVEGLRELQNAEVETFDSGERKMNLYTRAFVENFLEQERAAQEQEQAIESWGEGFETLSSKVESATAALQKFSDATSSNKGDALKGFASAYESFLTDWEQGFKGSSNVLAAVDLFFTPEQIAYWHKQGVELGEVLSNDVVQSFFKNAEGEFTKGGDYGANFASYLYDNLADAEGNITDATGKIVASIQKVGEEGSESLEPLIYNVDGLAEKLGLAPEVVSAFADAWGIYTGQFYENAEGIMAIARDMEGAITGITDGVASIDASTFFSGLLEGGYATQEQLYAIADQMQSMPELQLTVDGTEATAEQLEEVIQAVSEVNETPATAEVEGETEDAQSQVQAVQEQLDNIVGGSPYTGVLEADDNATSVIDGVQSAMSALDGTTATVTINAVQNGSTSVSTAASAAGTTNAAGGLTLVNEEGPEIIAEGNQARIANGGLPTLTYIQKGATVFNADDTRQILNSSGVQMFQGGIKAMAGGNFSGIPYKGSSSGSSDSGYSGGSSSGGYSSGGSSSGGGGSSSSDSDTDSETDEYLESLKDIVALRKSELDILDATNASTVEQANKEWEIMDALKAEWTYLQESGGEQKDINDLIAEFWETRQKIVELYKDEYETQASLKESELELLEKSDASVKSQIDKQNEIKAIYKKEMEYLMMFSDDQEEINKLKAKQLDIEKEIAKLRKGMYDDLREGIDNEIDAIEKERDAQTKLIDDRINALKKEHDLKEETEELEEKILAVQEAEANLQKAQNERTVRYFNAATGQWEWGANAKDVQSATEALEDAQKNLEDAYYQQEISDLEKQKELIEEEADARIKEWEEIKEVIAEPLLTVAEAIEELSKSADATMINTILKLNSMLLKFGYHIGTGNHGIFDSGGVLTGMGGIKATREDEMVIPPDITKRMLSPIAGNVFTQRMSELSYLYGNRSLAGRTSSIGSQYNGDTYNFGSISLTESQAKNTTVYQLARLSRGLRSYAAAN